jgi:hydroxyacylglutathione hydrolase
MPASVSNASVHDLSDALNEKDASGQCQIIDVREAMEYESERVAASRHAPLSTLPREHQARLAGLDRSRPLYVLCRTGARAEKAAHHLAELGWSDVRIVDGGTLAWHAAGLPLERTGRKTWSLERQVRLTAGSLVVVGAAVGFFVHPVGYALSAFIGAGLVFAAVTNTCGMAMVLAKMPWNRASGATCAAPNTTGASASAAGESCKDATMNNAPISTCGSAPATPCAADTANAANTKNSPIQQYYLACLAHGSYLIADSGEAAVIDPQRDVDQYIADAASRGAKIRWIIETHLHADFVSGHIELARRTGATIVLGARAGATFPHHAAKDGETLNVGALRLKLLDTPGHTPESITIHLTDPRSPADPGAVFTGDTLFIGDVGRPDLVASKGVTAPEMAGMLYDSLHQKLLPLTDGTLVYPAHGAGSACGKNISNERSSTLGAQKRANWALQPMTREAFIATLTQGLAPAPRYFGHDAEMNRRGATPLADLPAPAQLSPADFEARAKSGALILDVRDAASFGRGHVPGSINIGLGGQFASWAGTLLPLTSPLLLVADTDAAVAEAATRLARVGIEQVAGSLAGGIAAWTHAGKPVARVAQVQPIQVHAAMLAHPDLQLLDVRRPGEFLGGHAPGAVHAPLDTFAVGDAPASLPRGREPINISGGHSAWQMAGLPTETADTPAAA